MGMDNYRSYELARDIFGDSSADSFLGSLGAATFSPAEAIYGGQEGARQYKRADDLVGKGIGAATVGLSAMEAFPATALMAKGIRRMFPKSEATEEAVDVGRRKVSKGIAALPIAATGIAKVISDLPAGAATATKAAVKSIPEVTGSSLLDKLPFVQKQLKSVYYLRKDSPQGDLQAIYHLDDMKTELEQLAGIPRLPAPSDKNKEELLDKPLEDFYDRVAADKKELIDEKGDVRLEQFNFDTTIFDPNIDYGRYSIGFSRIGPGIGKTYQEAMAEIQNTKVGPEAAKKAQSDRDLQGLANQLLTYSNEQGPDGERILKFVQEKLALESAAIEPGGILFKTDADTQAALTFFAKKLAQDIKILAQRLPEYGGDAAGYKPADVTTAKRKIEQRKDLLNEVLAFARQFRGFDTNQLKLSDVELIERMDLGMSGDEFIEQLLMSKD